MVCPRWPEPAKTARLDRDPAVGASVFTEKSSRCVRPSHLRSLQIIMAAPTSALFPHRLRPAPRGFVLPRFVNVDRHPSAAGVTPRSTSKNLQESGPTPTRHGNCSKPAKAVIEGAAAKFPSDDVERATASFRCSIHKQPDWTPLVLSFH